MDSRHFLSRRPGRPIHVPSRPAIGSPTGTASVQIASAHLFPPGSRDGAGSPAPVAVDVRVENPGTERVDAVLVLVNELGAVTASAPLSLEAGEALEIPDLVAAWFGVPDASGSLRLESADGSPVPLSIEARAYARRMPFAAQAAGPRFWPALSGGESSRIELDVLNPSSSPEAFRVSLRSLEGKPRYSSVAIAVAAGERRRWSLAELVPVGDEPVALSILPEAGSALPVARAFVLDTASGSRIGYRPTEASARLDFPVTGFTAGAGGTYLTTEIALSNVSSSSTDVRVTFLPIDRDNERPSSAVLNLPAGASRPMEDLLRTLFGLTSVSGLLEVEAPAPVLSAAGRLVVRSEGSSAAVGRTIDPIGPERLSGRTALSSSGAEGGAPGAVGLFNPNAAPMPVSLRVEARDGGTLFETTVVLPARGSFRADLGALFPGLEDADAAPACVVTESALPHFAFAAAPLSGVPRPPDRLALPARAPR